MAASDLDTSSYRIAVQNENIANPAPLGLASFAVTTFVLSVHNAGWAPSFAWVGLAFFYGGAGQILAGQWEFKKDNVFAATAFTSFGCFWMALATFVLLEMLGWVPAGFDASNALGWFLSAFLIFNSYMLIATALLPKCIFITFFFLELAFLALTVGNFKGQEAGASGSWVTAGGYIGVITSAAALYSSMAALLNSTAKRTVVWSGTPLIKVGKKNAPLHTQCHWNCTTFSEQDVKV